MADTPSSFTAAASHPSSTKIYIAIEQGAYERHGLIYRGQLVPPDGEVQTELEKKIFLV